MSQADWWVFVIGIGVPVIGALVAWLWKLESRVFDLRGDVLKRSEFYAEVTRLREDIKSLHDILLREHYREESRREEIEHRRKDHAYGYTPRDAD